MRWAVIMTALALIFAATRCAAQKSSDELERQVIPIDQPSPAADAARASIANGFPGVTPRVGMRARSLVTKDGNFVLYGDLFKTGGCFMLFDMPFDFGDRTEDNQGLVVLAERQASRWQLRGLWRMGVVWRPRGWKNPPDDHLPVTPATRPFELRDFDDDGIPEVTIAGDVNKYYQEYYLLRFDPQSRGLTLLEYAMSRPERVGDYVRLYFDSGRLSEFEEWKFLRWSKGKLVTKATWHDGVNRDDAMSSFIRGEVTARDGTQHNFDIAYTDESDQAVDKDGKWNARIVISFRRGTGKFGPTDFNQMKNAWLFEKLTGLSRQLFPRRPDIKRLGRMEDYATVRVTGSDEAVRRLTVR